MPQRRAGGLRHDDAELREPFLPAYKRAGGRKEITKARCSIAKLLCAEKAEIYFTSGGTEANNLAVFGAVDARKRMGNKIVTTAVEHSSVFESCRELERQGYEVVFLKPKNGGRITPEQILKRWTIKRYSSVLCSSTTKRAPFSR